MVATPPLSAFTGKLARQVLEVTFGKMRFCRALFTIKALRRKQILSFRIVTSRYNQPAAARRCQVLLDKVILDSK